MERDDKCAKELTDCEYAARKGEQYKESQFSSLRLVLKESGSWEESVGEHYWISYGLFCHSLSWKWILEFAYSI